ncbi:MAG: redoxin domain-containing protein [Gammaproteobacteria bacterium]|nr:redoxin domain-containing protein [Gammaproteobacteria bacterium]NIR98395.1 redoxin domain-containing protein [Gammaproteobacteria bacterium]NIT64149.1 redoxin domain-containing protein [Gammaproteobacteria bacterium]NIY32729.1 redoxin domain-containing protein [Gammaproteobacteria bacterium]
MLHSFFLAVVLAAVHSVAGARAIEPAARTLTVGDGVEIPLTRYAAPGERALLWLPSESGILEQERHLAARLAGRGVEVWLADLHGAYFLAPVESSIDRVPAGDIAQLIAHVRRETGKRVHLVAAGRGALLALRGARAWQREAHAGPLGGVVLISPKLFAETPEPGRDGDLVPVVRASDLPIFVLQPAKSPWRWQLDRTAPALAEGGSDVYLRILPDVRDRFYFRPDAVAQEDLMAQRLPGLIRQTLPLLAAYAGKPRRPPAQVEAGAPAPPGKRERTLREYKGDPRPPPLGLEGLDGRVHGLDDYRGGVVLVNFWASWCPPCVHEMPSMQRLKEWLAGRPFTILAVNMAEERETIEAFLRDKVNVDFTVLLDRDGRALKRWKVFAFPTSYVVDRRGRIRYALFGAIAWDAPDVIAKMEELLAE